MSTGQYEPKDLYEGYYYLILTLDPNPHNDKGLYRWCHLEKRDGSFLGFKKEPECIRTALEETGIYCRENTDRGDEDKIYEIWFIRNPDTFLSWFVEKFKEKDIPLLPTKDKGLICTIKDIERLWNQEHIELDFDTRCKGLDTTQFESLKKYLSSIYEENLKKLPKDTIRLKLVVRDKPKNLGRKKATKDRVVFINDEPKGPLPDKPFRLLHAIANQQKYYPGVPAEKDALCNLFGYRGGDEPEKNLNNHKRTIIQRIPPLEKYIPRSGCCLTLPPEAIEIDGRLEE